MILQLFLVEIMVNGDDQGYLVLQVFQILELDFVVTAIDDMFLNASLNIVSIL